MANGISVDLDELLLLRGDTVRLRPPRRRARTSLIGPQRTTFRGRGMEFAELREYAAGDDVRDIDWRVTARSGKAHTKLYQPERERPVYFVVDFSAAMHFGTRVAFKSVIASRAAALLAWQTLDRRDRIGGVMFNETEHRELRPTGGRRGLLQLFHGLSEFSANRPDAESATAQTMGDVLARMRQVVRPGSTLYLLSDFQQIDDNLRRQLSLLRQHNDVFAFCVRDPLETAPPSPDQYRITDGSQTSVFNSAERNIADGYRKRCLAHDTELVELFGRANLPLALLRTDADLAPSIGLALDGRESMAAAMGLAANG